MLILSVYSILFQNSTINANENAFQEIILNFQNLSVRFTLPLKYTVKKKSGNTCFFLLPYQQGTNLSSFNLEVLYNKANEESYYNFFWNRIIEALAIEFNHQKFFQDFTSEGAMGKTYSVIAFLWKGKTDKIGFYFTYSVVNPGVYDQDDSLQEYDRDRLILYINTIMNSVIIQEK